MRGIAITSELHCMTVKSKSVTASEFHCMTVRPESAIVRITLHDSDRSRSNYIPLQSLLPLLLIL